MSDVPAGEASVIELATDAYVWGYPRMISAKYLGEFRQSGAAFNQFLMMDRMATPNQGGVNVDTLYGVAWLDLGAGPVVISLPDAHDRYYSIQLVDAHANAFAYVGRRTTGTQAQHVLITPPDWHDRTPDGMTRIASPSRYLFAFLRTLIDDEADVAVANRFHEGITVAPFSRFPDAQAASRLLQDLDPYFPRAHNFLERWGAGFFDRLGDSLAEDPPTDPQDIALMRRFAPLGIGPGLHPAASDDGRLATAVQRGTEQIFGATASTARKGWSAFWRMDDDSKSPLLKATIARFGIGVLNLREAIYLLPTSPAFAEGHPVPAWTSLAPDGRPFNGGTRYRLRFAADQQPQVDAFWSLTLYKADFFLFRNAIDRYAIGDRTRGLRYGDDGSLEILIQHEPPASGTSNWLPAPAGDFMLVFRAYQPRAVFLDGRYQLPAVDIITMD